MTVRPSYKQGFARSAGESKYPNLWKGLIAAFVPSLGVTGNVLHDQGSNKYSGIIASNVTWEVSSDGYMLRCPGATNNHIDTGMGDIGNQFSIVMWVNPSAISGYDVLVGESGSHGLYLLNGKINYYDNQDFTGGTTLPTGEISCVGMSTDAGNHTVYLNGKDDNGAGQSNANTFSPLTLSSSAERFDGLLGNTLFYKDKVLSPAEFKFLSDNPLAPFILKDLPFGFVAGAPPAGNPWYYYAQQ